MYKILPKAFHGTFTYFDISILVQVQLRTEVAYYAPQVRPDRGSNSRPPDHTFHVTETHHLSLKEDLLHPFLSLSLSLSLPLSSFAQSLL